MSTIMAHNVTDSLRFRSSSVANAIRTLNYYASLILLLGLSVQEGRKRWTLTSAQESSRRQVEMNALDLSASVLSFCADQDPPAAHFLKVLNLFTEKVKTEALMGVEGLQYPFADELSRGLVATPTSRGSVSTLSSRAGSLSAPSDATTGTDYSSVYGSLQGSGNVNNYVLPSMVNFQDTQAASLGAKPTQNVSHDNNLPIPLDWSLSDMLAPDPTINQPFDCDTQSIDLLTQHGQPWSR
jgi:hypothetical protein